MRQVGEGEGLPPQAQSVKNHPHDKREGFGAAKYLPIELLFTKCTVIKVCSHESDYLEVQIRDISKYFLPVVLSAF